MTQAHTLHANFVLATTFAATLWTPLVAHAADTEYYQPDHIVIVIEENKNYDQIIGSDKAPFINELAKKGANMTRFHGVWHPSQPNYIAFFGGTRNGVDHNNIPDGIPWNTPNLGAQMIQAGHTFVGYSESMPEIGFNKFDFMAGAYARRHNPWANWQADNPTENQLPPETNQPLIYFERDYSKLPTLSIIVPNNWNNMHNSSIERGDQWLRYHMSEYVEWAPKNNSLFILTFDESNGSKENHIATIFVGAGVKPGNYDMPSDLHGLRRTIQAIFGLSEINSFLGERIISTMEGKDQPRKPITEVFDKPLRGA